MVTVTGVTWMLPGASPATFRVSLPSAMLSSSTVRIKVPAADVCPAGMVSVPVAAWKSSPRTAVPAVSSKLTTVSICRDDWPTRVAVTDRDTLVADSLTVSGDTARDTSMGSTSLSVIFTLVAADTASARDLAESRAISVASE